MGSKTIIIIPARFGSSRYRGKPLVKILGRELILRVTDICAKTVGVRNTYVATDDNRIAKKIKSSNYNPRIQDLTKPVPRVAGCIDLIAS